MSEQIFRVDKWRACRGYAAMSIAAIARHLRIGERMIVKGCCRLGRHDETLSSPVRLVVMRLASGELLTLACSGSGAVVALAPVSGGTLLKYDVDAQIGGKLAQIGQRLVNGAAKKLANEFFDNFSKAVNPSTAPSEA